MGDVDEIVGPEARRREDVADTDARLGEVYMKGAIVTTLGKVLIVKAQRTPTTRFFRPTSHHPATAP